MGGKKIPNYALGRGGKNAIQNQPREKRKNFWPTVAGYERRKKK